VTLLAIMISRPSSTQATPRATTSMVWNRDHPSRSSRAGMRLRMGSVFAFFECACATAIFNPLFRCELVFPRWRASNQNQHQERTRVSRPQTMRRPCPSQLILRGALSCRVRAIPLSVGQIPRARRADPGGTD
jgi:hypothetical protein